MHSNRIYAEDAIPDSLIEGARIDGAGELQIFIRIALPQLDPGLVTVLLFTLVATWNNYFLPLPCSATDSSTPSP
jgi:multiple sugar transport system permease protein